MSQAGNIFKHIRKTRHLSLEEVTGGEFSASMLSRFENGKSDMTFQHLRTCLNNVYLDMSEFISLVSGFEPTELEKLHQAIQKYRNPFQKEPLLALLAEQEQLLQTGNKSQFYQLNSIWIKAILHGEDENFSISQKEINFLTDYLFQTEFWARYELLLFSDTSHLFPPKTYLHYCRELIKHSEFWYGNFINSNYVQTILVTGVGRCVDQEDFLSASILISMINQHFADTRDAYMKMIQLIFIGYYEAAQGMETGREKIKKGIHLLESLDYGAVALYYRDHLKDYLSSC